MILCLIRRHNRPVPAIFVPVLNWYIEGGSMLRMRAIYVHQSDTDNQGMPTTGKQLFRFIVSICDDQRLELHWCLGEHQGYVGHILNVRLKIGLNWRFCYKMRRLGGLSLYKTYQNVIWKLFAPKRDEHSYVPRWNVA